MTLLKALSYILIILCSFCFAPAPYEQDLRAAVVHQSLVLHLSIKRIARLNGISERTVRRYIERFQTFGSVQPDHVIFGETRGPSHRIRPRDLVMIKRIISEDCTLYVDEIRTILILRGGTPLSRSRIHFWIRKLGYTRQKLFHVEYNRLFHVTA